jgi:hypothetical protein
MCFVILRRECVQTGGTHVMCIYSYHTLHTREGLNDKPNAGLLIEILYYVKSNVFYPNTKRSTISDKVDSPIYRKFLWNSVI